MAKQLQSIRGIHEGLPGEVANWQFIERQFEQVFRQYAFAEVRLPVLEPTELFVRSIGEETDIVSKEMYAFEDQGGDHLCLRPEGTAGAVRAYLQAGLTRSGGQRWYYKGPMFRRERPQKGRLRQFQQIGAEWFGASGPAEDIDMLAMAWQLIQSIQLQHVHMEINSLGCPDCRPAYRDTLQAYLTDKQQHLCETCHQRMHSNPMRVLDCKVQSCQQQLTDAPEMVAHLCEPCTSHFDTLKTGLAALAIPFVVNARIVRGLDYYNRTAFEIITDQLGAQGTVLAGGRYDGLVSELGGPATPAIGFAAGLERLGLLLEASAVSVSSAGVDVAVAALGDATLSYSLQVAQQLRQHGLTVLHCGGGNAKRQFKVADRESARFVAVLGEDEMQAQSLTLKNLASGEQITCDITEAIQHIK